MIITNLVYTTSFAAPLELPFIHNHLPNTKYNPDNFRGLIIKIESGTCLVFHNGKVVIVGTRARKDAIKVRDALFDELDALGFCVAMNDIKLANIVAFHKYDTDRVHLDKLYEILRLEYNVSFEPELSPALMLKLPGTVRIFHNGKVIFTGFTDFGALDVAFDTVGKLLKRKISD